MYFTSYKKDYVKLEIMSVSVLSEDKDDFGWKESVVLDVCSDAVQSHLETRKIPVGSYSW